MRRLLAWAVFLLGDAVSRVMNSADWLGHLYPAYSRLMQWSDTIQGPSDRGPWSAVASGIEAATAVGTTEIGPTEGESPVPKADAQRPPQ
jgi:hypothetical protein